MNQLHTSKQVDGICIQKGLYVLYSYVFTFWRRFEIQTIEYLYLYSQHYVVLGTIECFPALAFNKQLFLRFCHMAIFNCSRQFRSYVEFISWHPKRLTRKHVTYLICQLSHLDVPLKVDLETMRLKIFESYLNFLQNFQVTKSMYAMWGHSFVLPI